MALCGFAAACVVGAAVGNPPTTILLRALAVLAACYLVGRLVGAVASRAVDDHIERYKRDHPIPGEDAGDGAAVHAAGPGGAADGDVAAPTDNAGAARKAA